MTFVIDYSAKRKGGGDVENFVVDRLMKTARIDRSTYGLRGAEFNGSQATVTIKPKQELNLKLPMAKGSIKAEFPTTKDGRYTFSFTLSPEHSIQFNDETLFHHFLNENMGGYSFNECDFTLPEKAEIYLHYRDVPFGIWRALPKGILEKMASFEMVTQISGQGQQYHLGWSSGEEKQEPETVAVSFLPYDKDDRRRNKFRKGLANAGLIEQKRGSTSLIGEMDFNIVTELEKVLAEFGGTPNNYRVDGEFIFSGEVNTGALQGVPIILDGEGASSGLAILREDSYIKYPNFSLRPSDHHNGGTIVTVNLGNLEQAAALSNMFYEQHVNISVEKQRRRVA